MIQVHYFAILKELSHKSSENIVESFPNASLLYKYLQTKYQFPLSISQLQLAINDEFASWDQDLKEGDTVVFIPPVAGG